MNIYQRIIAVRKEVAYIRKDKDVSTGSSSYKAVTHDAVTAIIREHLNTHGIVIVPNIVESQTMPVEKEGKDGKKSTSFLHVARYDFAFVNADDPADSFVASCESHGADPQDKGPGKSFSYAKKYIILKVLELETGEDEESRYGPDEAEIELGLARDEINAAPTLEILKAAFTASFKLFNGNKAAQKELIAAKDAKKKALDAKANDEAFAAAAAKGEK